MKKRFESFAHRLTRKVIITVLVTMTLISVVIYFVSAAGLLVFTRLHYADIMDKAKGNMAMVMSTVEVSAENIIDELSWHLATPDLAASTLEYELKTNRNLSGCGIGFVADYYPEQGRWYEPYALNSPEGITLKFIGSEKHDYFNLEWYQRGLESPEGVWSNPYLDEDGAGAVLCTYSRLVKTPEGKVAGVFGADMSLEGLSDLIVNNVNRENTESPFVEITEDDKDIMIYCFIIGPNGDYIVHPDKSRILQTNYYDFAVGKGADKYRKLGDAMRAGESGGKIVVIDGIESEVYFAPLLASGWSMAIVVPTRRLLMPGFVFGTMIIILILIGLLIVFFICQHTIKKSTKPLIHLTESAREVAMGNFDTELPEIKENDEIRQLRDSFDNMQQSLAHYVEDLRVTTAQKASMESELSVARNIQMSMVPVTWPAFPERKDLDIYGILTPAKAVGGDLYDFRLRGGVLFFCIGDVSGKGVPASLVMTEISSMFRTVSATEDSPARIVSSINASISGRNDSLMFVTLFVGALDLATGALQYANAGHNAPVVISGGKARMLDVKANVPVGVVPDAVFPLEQTTLAPGSILFLYTDGLTEATRSDGMLFEEERMLEQLSGQDENMGVEALIAHMTDAVAAFVGDAEQSDDLTMLAIKLLPR